MKNRLTLAQVIRAVKITGAALMIGYCAVSMFLIIALAGDEADQNKTINLVIEDNRVDACRDKLEQDFLGVVGALIIRGQTDSVDQITIDRLTNAVDRLDQVDTLCPLPKDPEDFGD